MHHVIYFHFLCLTYSKSAVLFHRCITTRMMNETGKTRRLFTSTPKSAPVGRNGIPSTGQWGREWERPFSPRLRARKGLTPRTVWEKAGEYHSPSKFLISFLFLFLATPHSMRDLPQGSNLRPLLWKHRVLGAAREVPKFLFTPLSSL